MLRLIVLALLLLNVGYFSWGQGWLRPYGWGPTDDREPQRFQQQIHPRSITLISDKEAAKLLTPAVPAVPAVSSVPAMPPVPNESVCLQSGWMDAPRTAALRQTLERTLQEGDWTLAQDNLPERWMIYLGRYANAADVIKKRAQLTRLDIKFEVLNNSLAPGLSLGAYPSQALANTALETFVQRGVRTARVVMERASVPGYRLRLTGDADAVQTRFNLIKATLPGKTLTPCPKAVF